MQETKERATGDRVVMVESQGFLEPTAHYSLTSGRFPIRQLGWFKSSAFSNRDISVRLTSTTALQSRDVAVSKPS